MICMFYNLCSNSVLFNIHVIISDFYSRRVLFEDYRFDLNGNSPLTEKFLRSRQLLKKAGTQLFISHPQIIQVPLLSAETYDNEIKRAARICRTVRAQKHKLVVFF
jgi:hypothetical protein